MINCKRKDCFYASFIMYPEGENSFCDYTGKTGKIRGVYGEDLKQNCPQYKKAETAKKSQIAFGSPSYIAKTLRKFRKITQRNNGGFLWQKKLKCSWIIMDLMKH